MAPGHGLIDDNSQDKKTLRPQSSSSRFGRMPYQGGPRFRPPVQRNWGLGWRSSSGDRGNQLPDPQHRSSGQRRGSQSSTDQQSRGTVNTQPSRRRGCYVCGHLGCHSDFHREDGVSPPSAPRQSVNPAPGPAPRAVNPQSNWQRGPRQGERAPPANVPPRP